MNMILPILSEGLRTAILVTGLVIVMMMLIEVLNIKSGGGKLELLRGHKVGQVLLSGVLGLVPGCMGGFAAVSLYTHGLISFGALVAMMIASSGDEAFIMLAMFPGRSLWIFIGLFVVAVGVGLLTDLFNHKDRSCHALHIHEEDRPREHKHAGARHWGWKRILMAVGVLFFLAALLTGMLEDHGEAIDDIAHHRDAMGFNLLSEEWMYWLFSLLGVCLLVVLLTAGNHFVEEHLWEHIVCRHLPSVFAWTFGTLIVVGLLMNWFDVSEWISGNVAFMIVLAALVGIIPESGPHMLFVSLYAAGVVPIPVLLASCISQDGHASLPLLAESRRAFIKAKLINVVVAIIVGFACNIFM